jgi:hypothetical protein
LPASGSQLTPDQPFDRGKCRLFVQLELEQFEFEVVDPVL